MVDFRQLDSYKNILDKKATANNTDSRRESEEEEEASEEESPRIIEPVERIYEQVRSARLN